MSRTRGHRKSCNRRSCFACSGTHRGRIERDRTRLDEGTDASLEEAAVERYESQFNDRQDPDPDDDEEPEPEEQDERKAPFDGAFF
jgi:hypothetical protein